MNPPKPYLPADEAARIWKRSTRRRFESAPGRHSELVVLLGISGKASYFLDGSLMHLKAQTALFCHPGLPHYLVGESAEFDMVVAVVSIAILPEQVREAASSTAKLRYLPKPAYEEACRMADQLIAAPAGAMESGIVWWLHRLWTQSDLGALPLPASAHPKVAHAIELLYADPGTALGDVAASAGLTPTRLGQVFRAQTGQTLRAFRQERRFETFDRIREINPSGTLLEAALEAGFGDYSSFYRAYRRRYGHGPRNRLKPRGPDDGGAGAGFRPSKMKRAAQGGPLPSTVMPVRSWRVPISAPATGSST